MNAKEALKLNKESQLKLILEAIKINSERGLVNSYVEYRGKLFQEVRVKLEELEYTLSDCVKYTKYGEPQAIPDSDYVKIEWSRKEVTMN